MKPTCRKRRKPQGKPQVRIVPAVLASVVASVEKRWSVTLAHKESRHA